MPLRVKAFLFLYPGGLATVILEIVIEPSLILVFRDPTLTAVPKDAEAEVSIASLIIPSQAMRDKVPTKATYDDDQDQYNTQGFFHDVFSTKRLLILRDQGSR